MYKRQVLEGVVTVILALNLKYGYSIMDVSAKVQEKVKASIENMTGLTVADVNIRVAGVDTVSYTHLDVYKRQNMNKAHRDRIAFMRICSGEFEAGMDVFHIQGGKKVRLSQPQQMMASERKMIEKAYGGDIIGVFDPGIFSIGDTLTNSPEKFAYEGIPTFAPEHFARVRQVDTMKRKQFIKGINQIAQEGAIQIFQEYNTGMEEIIVGVVGVLQFDVLKYRLENEYNVEIRMDTLPYEHIRWIENKEIDLDKIVGTSDMKKIKDLKDRPLLLFVNSWSIRMTLDRNEGLELSEFGK